MCSHMNTDWRIQHFLQSYKLTDMFVGHLVKMFKYVSNGYDVQVQIYSKRIEESITFFNLQLRLMCLLVIDLFKLTYYRLNWS